STFVIAHVYRKSTACTTNLYEESDSPDWSKPWYDDGAGSTTGTDRPKIFRICAESFSSRALFHHHPMPPRYGRRRWHGFRSDRTQALAPSVGAGWRRTGQQRNRPAAW